jgi:hypothetical protein
VDKGIRFAARLSNSLVHERCDSVIIMSGDELGESPSVELAAGSTESRCESLGILKHVVWNGHRGFIPDV